jgi:hypothetical protein
VRGRWFELTYQSLRAARVSWQMRTLYKMFQLEHFVMPIMYAHSISLTGKENGEGGRRAFAFSLFLSRGIAFGDSG